MILRLMHRTFSFTASGRLTPTRFVIRELHPEEECQKALLCKWIYGIVIEFQLPDENVVFI